MVALVPTLGSKPRPGDVTGPCKIVGLGVGCGGVKIRGIAGEGGVTTGVTTGVVVPPLELPPLEDPAAEGGTPALTATDELTDPTEATTENV